ncbi:hypothetical protein GCM10010297_02850 [Streptomyces malachitofuscus]|nr:hypothetical protein GCM10010297_02850 [Streptomyces malachitofuscus]
MVGGLLFLAFAYFAVGQAAANRNDAQTAADAAALSAAQDRRDQLGAAWKENLLDPTKWQQIFDGTALGLQESCWQAEQLATQNNAVVLHCTPVGALTYTVDVETNDTVGDSIVPGTENKRSTATATAVIEPLCEFELPAEGSADDALPLLDCKERQWKLDPKGPKDLLPNSEDLFDVHLAD